MSRGPSSAPARPRPPAAPRPTRREAEDGTVEAILIALSGIHDSIRSQNAASTEDRKLLHEMHERLIRIEVEGLAGKVESLETRVDALERDRDRREGAVSAFEWLSRFGPWLLTIVATAAAVIGWDRANG